MEIVLDWLIVPFGALGGLIYRCFKGHDGHASLVSSTSLEQYVIGIAIASTKSTTGKMHDSAILLFVQPDYYGYTG